MRTRWLFSFWLVLLVAALPALVGCKGDRGRTGAEGPQGMEGPPGEAGTDATVSVETLAALGLVYSGDVTPINPVIDLSNTVSYDATTGAVSVHFTLQDEDGNGIDITKLPYELRVYVSELIPAEEEPADDNPGPAWNRLIYEHGTPALAGSEPEGTLTLNDADTGDYTYVLAGTLEATDHVIRVTVVTNFRFRDNNGAYVVVANPTNDHYDFLQSDPGTKLASSGADEVATSGCESCHGARINDVGHSRYTQVTTCNNCHNRNYMADHDPNADFAHMIHSIHAAQNFSVGDFSEVTYPQNLYNCGKCHAGPDAAETYKYPSRMNCGPCHSDVNFETGDNHPGGIQTTDAACSLCHGAEAIQGYHDPATNPGILTDPAIADPDLAKVADIPEFDVTITMTDPANKAAQEAAGELPYYVAGETPVITVTLKDHATGEPVASSVYTSDADAKGVSGGALSGANLYVYGPRDEAVPVETTCSTTDPDFQAHDGTCGDTPTQGHSLLLSGGVPANDDSQVITDGNGYKYQLMDNIGDLAPGTYMVRFEGADYGGVASDDYRTSSVALINFQVGTGVEEAKVSGDACINCHGDTHMHLTGTHAHNPPFNTDHCLGCHDRSGNYGDYIGNRVHAVHRATVTGDFHDRNWAWVTFPRPANNCTTCHTNPDAPTPVWTTPYMLACGGCHGLMPDADPTDPSYLVDEDGDALEPTDDADAALIEEIQAKLTREVAAAQHMRQNGGDAEADAVGEPPTLQCLICHGPGRVADLYVTHHLATFGVAPEPDL